MKINILLFGKLISIAQGNEIWVSLKGESCTVKELLFNVYEKFPSMMDEKFRVVINQSIATDKETVTTSDEVALLPPICGGNDLYLTHDPITTEYVAKVTKDTQLGMGSMLSFLGIVRNDHIAQELGTDKDFREVKSLTYSAYELMAEREINKIIIRAKERFGLVDVVVKHRIGEVEVGETAFFVAVSSEHRKESIHGIDFIIDEVKSKVPIWKLENYDDGSEIWKGGKLMECGI